MELTNIVWSSRDVLFGPSCHIFFMMKFFSSTMLTQLSHGEKVPREGGWLRSMNDLSGWCLSA